jgi:hypothetical protein
MYFIVVVITVSLCAAIKVNTIENKFLSCMAYSQKWWTIMRYKKKKIKHGKNSCHTESTVRTYWTEEDGILCTVLHVCDESIL